ncbi:SDR family NAD(P)-dependent oxidoreductase [Sphingomonas aliaeris]|uniref:SDR family NAD(P)-dependent oxidoreductase n=1 Tax=Sphingomonas aliaeris TaxID=2759526 RepID=A0A974NUR9_9SPHN|nr:SDR family NAD(P)-dependent oxidoreductase [Sphingomonas aliaeris]QQV77358.1 SDR family NAD(P)-dependent oxidoreductase [Sphingomonas aliaeris]
MTAIERDNLAVVTGAASGIGLEAAKAFAAAGMRVVVVDRSDDATMRAALEIGDLAFPMTCDVSDRKAFDTLAATIGQRHGTVSVLMNNAGIGAGGDVLAPSADWDAVLGVNLMGVVHGVQAFVPAMLASDAPGVVINTGSKQGITQPPGNTAYNVSKAGVKALTEGLAHTLRSHAGGRITAHLLIPGFTYTGMTARSDEKPAGAWSAKQVVDHMLTGIAAGDFYILCPDNETTTAQDHKRILWAAGDIVENRPALSRWHPDWKDRFARYMAER